VPLENLEISERKGAIFLSISFIILANAHFSRRSLQLCPRSSVRVMPLSSRTWLCATKSACFRGPQENARN
jgi:hypothetical protein